MAKFQIEIKECLRIKKEFIAMIEELKDYEKRLYAVKENLKKMSEYTGIVNRLDRECQAVTGERTDVERLFQTFCDCVQCYKEAEKNVKEQKIDWHFVLDMAGLIPGAGALFDGVNTAWYAAEGDVENALLSGLALFPVIGEVTGVEGQADAVDGLGGGEIGQVVAAGAAGKTKKGEESAGELGKYVDDAVERGSASGTVWDNINATQDCYPNTNIPKSFEVEVNGQKMWVHGNATEHMYDEVYAKIIAGEGTAYTNPNLYTQRLMSDFYSSLEQATSSGIKYGELISSGNWEFIFAPPRQEGLLPVIKHAQFNGW